ncbi:MAG: type VI secretion system baseplate subunit TssK [Candidatus Malihini olakiniferum]
MKTPRPRWNKSTLLSSLPSQFTPVWNRHSRKYPSPQSLSSAWGVEVLRLDEEAMQHQQLTIKQLQVFLPDGTWVNSSDMTALSCAVDLDKQLAQELQQVDVLLAFPSTERQLGVQYQYLAEEPPAMAYQGRNDVLVQSEKNVVASTTIGLHFSIDEKRGYRTHRIARLNRNAQGLWEIYPSFIPPLLVFSAAPMLVAQAEKLLANSRLKRRNLLALRYKQPGQRIQPDISLFWMLNVLNRYESVLNGVSLTTGLHIELVYRELVKLAGPLALYTGAEYNRHSAL